MSWVEQAACRGRPIDWWYPPSDDRFAGDVAIAVCRSCPVRRQCLASALAEESAIGYPPSGIRAGLRPEQRRRMLRSTGYSGL